MIVIRFGYCPPNPGWKCKTKWHWFRSYQDAIEFAYENNRFNDIWVSYNGQRYRELSFNKLCELWEIEKNTEVI
jgi:hypothetical protein